ncbi:MAG: hypothetical protein QFB87_01780 [Patescibacteria group bacterium]|nr:hypothetical protein [Patescibacteria group bacterium]
MNHKKLSLITALVVAVLVTGAIGIEAHATRIKSTKLSQQYAQQIPQGTYFARVRELSVGKKPICLSRNTALDQTVQADDKLRYEESMSPALGTVIPDMPAGNTTTYLHTYTNTSATGYETFSDQNQQSFVGDLKSFNFGIRRSAGDGSWKLTSFVACTE